MTASPLDLTDQELREGLTACLAVPRWVDEVARAAPFDSLPQLLQVAAAAATPLSAEEVDQALAHHPRIGEKAQGQGGLLGGVTGELGNTTEGLGQGLNSTTRGLGSAVGQTTAGVGNTVGGLGSSVGGAVGGATGGAAAPKKQDAAFKSYGI